MQGESQGILWQADVHLGNGENWKELVTPHVDLQVQC